LHDPGPKSRPARCCGPPDPGTNCVATVPRSWDRRGCAKSRGGGAGRGKAWVLLTHQKKRAKNACCAATAPRRRVCRVTDLEHVPQHVLTRAGPQQGPVDVVQGARAWCAHPACMECHHHAAAQTAPNRLCRPARDYYRCIGPVCGLKSAGAALLSDR
jgi:hypothetical protein